MKTDSFLSLGLNAPGGRACLDFVPVREAEYRAQLRLGPGAPASVIQIDRRIRERRAQRARQSQPRQRNAVWLKPAAFLFTLAFATAAALTWTNL